ncbi:hypothetical protein [Niabella hibiscisoli]|uniref:hypothetical protein n=1 Tax=Niabella hibiscisoli TaxID=1825928 RepID=UPI001F0E8A81|nr:hypothetical protein [Niabella hibiscisoli]MCH5718528.1 hypothetical protein [Niabella hibiscisoli]
MKKKIWSGILMGTMLASLVKAQAQQALYEMDRSSMQSVSLNSTGSAVQKGSWSMKKFSEGGAGEQVSSVGNAANGWLPAIVPERF